MLNAPRTLQSTDDTHLCKAHRYAKTEPPSA